ncbi:MAG TPA: hypothetical protein VFE46_07860 [Pirellulales bacterium]|nr:hypothetical protein [Pirellulales bacterium]
MQRVVHVPDPVVNLIVMAPLSPLIVDNSLDFGLQRLSGRHADRAKIHHLALLPGQCKENAADHRSAFCGDSGFRHLVTFLILLL